jgi:hypothetical protein
LAAKTLRIGAQLVLYFGPNCHAHLLFSGRVSMSYFADAIIESGERYAIFPRSIGVTNSPCSNVMIGMAWEIGWTEEDGAIWSLKIGGKAVDGLFIIAESEFVQFEYVSELTRPRRWVDTPMARISNS